jgi:hypothetical protein
VNGRVVDLAAARGKRAAERDQKNDAHLERIAREYACQTYAAFLSRWKNAKEDVSK